jgi:hypothetical protein
MSLPANFASMSVEELWGIHEEISKLLEAKMLAEKKMLEQRLISPNFLLAKTVGR